MHLFASRVVAQSVGGPEGHTLLPSSPSAKAKTPPSTGRKLLAETTLRRGDQISPLRFLALLAFKFLLTDKTPMKNKPFSEALWLISPFLSHSPFEIRQSTFISMKPDNLHPEYLSNSDQWQTYRDILAGDPTMKRAGERYLARLHEQSDREFAEYVKRGFFFNATSRTVSGYVGLIFRKPPVLVMPDKSADAFKSDADLLGSSFASYCKTVVEETIVMGRCGTLVDFEASASENRPYFAFYTAENILNWRQQRINGKLTLTFLVLREWIEEPGEDDFEIISVPQLRVLRLLPAGQGTDLTYSVQVWRETKNEKNEKNETTWQIVSETVPTRHGKPLTEIPFVFHGPEKSKPPVEKSPIADIVAANLDHYRLNADYKHGMHFTALPTAWVSGFDAGSELRIGSQVAWVANQPGATANFLEFKGEGLSTFERAMDRTERLMTVLGSRLLENQKRSSESAEALSIRAAGEHSIVGSLATSVSASLTQALKWVHWWSSTVPAVGDITDQQAMVELNKDFETSKLTGPDLQALVSAWQAGAVSRETLIHNLRQGELLPPGSTTDED